MRSQPAEVQGAVSTTLKGMDKKRRDSFRGNVTRVWALHVWKESEWGPYCLPRLTLNQLLVLWPMFFCIIIHILAMPLWVSVINLLNT